MSHVTSLLLCVGTCWRRPACQRAVHGCYLWASPGEAPCRLVSARCRSHRGAAHAEPGPAHLVWVRILVCSCRRRGAVSGAVVVRPTYAILRTWRAQLSSCVQWIPSGPTRCLRTTRWYRVPSDLSEEEAGEGLVVASLAVQDAAEVEATSWCHSPLSIHRARVRGTSGKD